MLTLVAFCSGARSGAEEEAKPEGRAEHVEEARFRFVYYDQDGFGYQSAAQPQPLGSEYLRVLEPMLYLRARQNEKVTHTVTVPVDIITSASTDAVDITTGASRHNEAGTLQVDTQVQQTPDDELKFTYGGHGEEWFASAFGGFGYTRDLAEDNATVSVRVDGSYDWFKAYGPWPGAVYPEGNKFNTRASIGGSVELSQILNARTWVKGGYGVTWNQGDLSTPWNSVPFICDGDVTQCSARVQEIFPRTRLRQNVSGLLVHYVPRTKTTARVSYRFYFDDYDVRAHTVLAEAYQALGERVLFSALYRMHRQTAVSFWTRSLSLADFDLSTPRTADSDLAELWAHKWGVKLLFHITPPGRGRQHDIDVYFNRYTRTNLLHVNVMSVGYGYTY